MLNLLVGYGLPLCRKWIERSAFFARILNLVVLAAVVGAMNGVWADPFVVILLASAVSYLILCIALFYNEDCIPVYSASDSWMLRFRNGKATDAVHRCLVETRPRTIPQSGCDYHYGLNEEQADSSCSLAHRIPGKHITRIVNQILSIKNFSTGQMVRLRHDQVFQK